ncbi:MAG TPA: membrane-bound PQQ-dependent dehydrogenase, glucose/quinate/shikimate family [Ideonella sp.]|uniref:membrane-bound PQQ-dependent dehydrogenase, glucose/quinate/shikimate family n=1 Tax=Ideonella sp. TaxID=1929293 RepID=UPI002C268070|nr:membrane-bound PQQ-dependent dehydrogenase, glucose/quinate/shikimate family [Ideonella sp.]HSI51207.1 membrane-bound PQQ-dependent dehydrogenase, glucose/quinate/shikimate family [Ideonella sp.]
MPSALPRPPYLTALLLLLGGLALAVGGAWLLALGGTVYYLAAGLTLGVCGMLLWRRRVTALHLYALLVLVTLAWSLWEAGLDWWPLAARGDLLFVMGLWLLTPWVVRRLSPDERATLAVQPQRASPRWSQAAAPLAVVLALFLAVSMASWTVDAHRIEANGTAAAALPPPGAASDTMPAGDWQAYGRGAGGQRHSPLTELTPDNVGQLQVAWQMQTGDVRGQAGDPVETTFEVTPLKVGERLFLCTPHQSVLALDATTGRTLWRHEALRKPAEGLALQHLTCRGLSYSAAPGDAAVPAAVPASGPAGNTTACQAKLFMPTADGRLLALDPATGTPCAGFGTEGAIDLWAGMPNVKPGSYYSTSPVVVTKKLVIVGGTVLDNVSTHETSGVIRAFDLQTGALVWNFDSGRPEQTEPLPAGQTYSVNSPNSWSIASVDEALGLVYLPMGNQPPDQWGGKRTPAVERYSSSVTALDLATGQPRWVFQTVHHDLWDYDVPAQPSLIDLPTANGVVPALVQPTKQGELFVLDRRTGQAVLPINEQPAPQGAAEGDHSALTQPVSALSFNPPPLRESDMWGATMFDQLMCRIAFKQLRYEGRFTPPSEGGTLVYPGNFGVFNWGGVAVDPDRHTVFATPTYLAFVSKLVRRADDTTMYVQGGERPRDSLPALNENFGAPFAVKLSAFTSPLGVPCQAPPWGHVATADLTTGKVLWQHKNGTVRDSSPLPLPFRMGVPNLGGPITTAGGVAFLSGTLDDYVRGYDVRDGREIWRHRLPAGGQATPMTYRGADGRQYLLVIAGGHGSLGTKAGDHVIAFALPAKARSAAE